MQTNKSTQGTTSHHPNELWDAIREQTTYREETGLDAGLYPLHRHDVKIWEIRSFII